jgi:hypothetical protein
VAVKARLHELAQEYPIQAHHDADLEIEFLKARRASSRAFKTVVTSGSWDVAGSWRIVCPDIEDENRPVPKAKSRIKICTAHSYVTEHAHLRADFNFVTVRGEMRYSTEKNCLEPDGEAGSTKDVEQTTNTSSRRFSDIERLLNAETQPSSTQQSFSFRWCGEELSTETIEPGIDVEVDELVFDTPMTL